MYDVEESATPPMDWMLEKGKGDISLATLKYTLPYSRATRI